MTESDVLSLDIGSLLVEQRDAWRELARSTTTFERRELRNRIRQSEVELRDRLKMRTERLRFRPRSAEPLVDSLATINFRLF